MRVCLVYDCLFPWTVGGAERWMRSLAENLAALGNEVTYLTRKQWDDADFPEIPGVRVVAVSPTSSLYNDEGTRRIDEALRFGWGVFRYLSRHRNEFDIIHVTAAPFFGVFGAMLASVGTGVPVFVDWDETWTRDYWHEYLGRARGEIGWQVQQLCSTLARRSFVKSKLHAERLSNQGYRGELTVLPGLYDGPVLRDSSSPRKPPFALFAGRHIPEKRVLAIPPAIVEARKEIPDLEALILGDGPDREKLLREIDRLGAGDFISSPGFVATAQVERAMDKAACLVLPSSREGYGIVVVEAASRGTPAVLVAGPDNSAVELIEEGINGFVAPDASARTLGSAIVNAVRGDESLRGATASWFQSSAASISAAQSASVVSEHHRTAITSTRTRRPRIRKGQA
jgi:glycosyltransferase involved in cell wall biosynthesis